MRGVLREGAWEAAGSGRAGRGGVETRRLDGSFQGRWDDGQADKSERRLRLQWEGSFTSIALSAAAAASALLISPPAADFASPALTCSLPSRPRSWN